jgi:23S rRNA (pseudouridine1915-N3)-methyltransferase
LEKLVKKITLLCYGKLKTPGMEDAVNEFTKRMSRFTDFNCLELKPIKVTEKSDSNRDLIPEREGEQILELIDSPSFKTQYGRSPAIWCLDETGKSMKTTEWAKSLQTLADRGTGELVVIIGGSLGIGHNLLERANLKVSFGPQTLSHELARLVLVEQLYRSLSFSSGHPYHNEG